MEWKLAPILKSSLEEAESYSLSQSDVSSSSRAQKPLQFAQICICSEENAKLIDILSMQYKLLNLFRHDL
jgi:hypothetical protein